MNSVFLETINVQEIIKQQSAYEALGELLFKEIELVLKSINKPKLLVLDFTGLDLLTYGFIEIALKNIVDYTKKNNDILVLYEINKFELSELITGIIDMLQLQAQNTTMLTEMQLIANNYSIAHKEKKGDIQYIGKLNEVEEIILKIIEEKSKTTHNEIDDYLKAVNKAKFCEDITISVQKLYEHGFVFVEKNEDSPSYYYSLKYLQNHAN